MSNLSRDWTAGRFHKLAMADLGIDSNDAISIQRFDLMNKSFGLVTSLFYDLMIAAYMTPVTLVPDTLGRKSSSGTGTWTAATARLVFAGMNSSFASGDVGKVITFAIGASIYIGTIDSFVSTTTVVIAGANLPVTDGTVDMVIVVSSVPTGNVLSLAGLRIMRTGQQVKVELESTATKALEASTTQAVFNFDSSAASNLKKILWVISGEQLIFAKGNSLTSAGTFTFRYPRVPNIVTADTDPPDVVDGAAIEIALLHYKRVLAGRTGKESLVKDNSQEYTAHIASLYRTFGQEASADVLKEKIMALK